MKEQNILVGIVSIKHCQKVIRVEQEIIIFSVITILISVIGV